jgi:hypothetical protein
MGIAGARRECAAPHRVPASPVRLEGPRIARTGPEALRIGDTVETTFELPGLPAGSVGTVRAMDPLFVAVEFLEGRIGYYAPRQLRAPGAQPRQNPEGEP